MYNDAIANARPTPGLLFFHPNHLGSTALVTDASGVVQTTIHYKPYGEVIRDNEPDPKLAASSGPDSVRYKYTAQEEDPETSLMYYNARYYDPAIGRFVSADTIVDPGAGSQGFNRYMYVGGNPVNFLDSSGHSIEGILRLGALVLSVIGIVATFIPGAHQIWTGKASLALLTYALTGDISIETGTSIDGSGETYVAAKGGSSSGGGLPSIDFCLSECNDSSSGGGGNSDASLGDGFGLSLTIQLFSSSSYDKSKWKEMPISEQIPKYSLSDIVNTVPKDIFKTKSFVTKVLDGVQLGLDVAGMIPAFGIFADGANVLVSLARGDWTGAALSAAAMIPGAGQAAGAAKIALASAPLVGKIAKGGGSSLWTKIPSAGRKFNQIARRGWTKGSINKTVNSPFTTRQAVNKANGNPATAFFNKDGSHIIRDNVTGDLIQMSDRLKPWIPDSVIKNPYIP